MASLSGSLPAGDAIRAWKPRIAGIREVLHASFLEHDYPPHIHADWTVFIVDAGAIAYDLDRHDHGATPGRVSVLPPGVVHDGRVGRVGGYRKRVLYVDSNVLPEALAGPAVDRPELPDPRLLPEVAALHHALVRADDDLEAETRFAIVAARLRSALGRPDEVPPRSTDAIAARALRDVLDGRLFEPVSLSEAAAEAGWSPAHAARAFSRIFGIAPHAYVVGRRLDAARDRILLGQPLAKVAIEVGFADQAHMTSRFRRFLGTTPARFARGGSVAASGGRRAPTTA